MKDIIKTIWQLPQFLIGLLLVFLYRHKIVEDIKNSDEIRYVRVKDFKGGISLGKIIIVNSKSNNWTILHELGHSKQSEYLGPLYLIVIGLPSLIHNLIYKLCGRRWNYYSFYTEKWANKLMNL